MTQPDNGDQEFAIGAVSTQTGVKVETIRYYERIGLIPPPPRTLGGRRLYSQAHKRRLVFIRRMRELGFPLEDVRALLKMVDGQYTCADVHALTVSHLEGVRSRIDDLVRIAGILEAMASQCEAGETPGCPIVDALNPA